MISQSLVAAVLPAGVAAQGTLAGQHLPLAPAVGSAAAVGLSRLAATGPTLVHAHGLSVTLSCGGATPTVPADTSALRPDVWDAIFGHDSLVEPLPGAELLAAAPRLVPEPHRRRSRQVHLPDRGHGRRRARGQRAAHGRRSASSASATARNPPSTARSASAG